MAEQLANFAIRVSTAFGASPRTVGYANWLEALSDLARRMDQERTTTSPRQVIFFDELPWLASRRSGFVRAFSWFWNSWAVDRDVVVVVCGSAASWMIEKVVRDKGGLHNRITHRIKLDPFTLAETNLFMDARGLVEDNFQRLQLFMALGGVPFYLDQVKSGESAQQAIERLLFGPAAVLADEFGQLYASLFENSTHHVRLVKALAAKQSGITREQLRKDSGIESSGTLARVVEELEYSGFVLRTSPFGKTRRDALYMLVDEYSRFYLKFLDGVRPGKSSFFRLAEQAAFRSWQGYAFENVALRNVEALKRVLGISGVDVRAASFVAKASEVAGGVQVDLLLDRSDRVITLIEAKFTEAPFVMTSTYAKALREKKQRFRAHTKTRNAVTLVLLTTFGVSGNSAAAVGIVDRLITVDQFA